MDEKGLNKHEEVEAEQNEDDLYPEINRKAFLRKLDLKLLPPLTLLYLLSFLDRSNGLWNKTQTHDQ